MARTQISISVIAHTGGMKIWHRHHGEHEAESPAAVEKGLAGADYDAQADLALPTGLQSIEAGDVAMYGLDNFVEPPSEPGYDIDRDTAN